MASGAAQRAKLEILSHAHHRKKSAAFGHVSDAASGDLMRGKMIYSFAIKFYLAARRVDYARDRLQSGRLSSPIRSNQCCDLTLSNFERNAPKHLDVAVARG